MSETCLRQRGRCSRIVVTFLEHQRMKIMTRPGIVQEAIEDLKRAGLDINPLEPSAVCNASVRSETALPLSRPVRNGIGHGASSRAAVADVLAPQMRRPATPILTTAGSARPHAVCRPGTNTPFVQRIMAEIRADQLRAAQLHTDASHPG